MSDRPEVRAAKAAGIDYVIGEANSCGCGGQHNVSDTFASALWAVDVMLAHATIGVARWNMYVHSGYLLHKKLVFALFL